jgi:hypothetical protein
MNKIVLATTITLLFFSGCQAGNIGDLETADELDKVILEAPNSDGDAPNDNFDDAEELSTEGVDIAVQGTCSLPWASWYSGTCTGHLVTGLTGNGSACRSKCNEVRDYVSAACGSAWTAYAYVADGQGTCWVNRAR